jgi:hypothetical protein
MTERIRGKGRGRPQVIQDPDQVQIVQDQVVQDKDKDKDKVQDKVQEQIRTQYQKDQYSDSDDDNMFSRSVRKYTSDIFLYTIKTFLYERQEPDKGRLDGTLYFCKGRVNIGPQTIIDKSILPCYVIMERYRGLNNKIYYKLYVNREQKIENDILTTNIKLLNNVDLDQDLDLDQYEQHYYIKPIGAIHLYTQIMQLTEPQYFTFILQGSNISNYIISLNNLNYAITEPNIQIILQNVLYQYEYTDFMHHQYFSKVV